MEFGNRILIDVQSGHLAYRALELLFHLPCRRFLVRVSQNSFLQCFVTHIANQKIKTLWKLSRKFRFSKIAIIPQKLRKLIQDEISSSKININSKC